MDTQNQEALKPNLPTPSLPCKSPSFTMLLCTLIILGIGLVGGYFLGNNQGTLQKTNQIAEVFPTPLTENKFIYELKGECNSEECLFGTKDYIGGFGKIQGYYHTEKKTAWGNSTLCDTLTVTGGNKTLTQHFRNEVQKGNSINRIDENDNLILTLSLKNLDIQEQEKIKSSSPNTLVELSVIRAIEEGRGVPLCYSFVQILSTKLLK